MIREQSLHLNTVMTADDLADVDKFVNNTLRIDDSPNNEGMNEKMYLMDAPSPQPPREQTASDYPSDAPATRQDPAQSFDGSPSPGPSPTSPSEAKKEQQNEFTIAGFSGYLVLLFAAAAILIYNWR